jgi:uncharacterized membrane protein required for colicin V production
MITDLCLVAAVLAFGVFGYFSGAIRQLTHWAGLACGWLIAPRLAARLTPAVAARLRLPAVAVRVGLDGVLFCVLGALAAFFVHWILARLAGVAEEGRVDRAGGFALGAGKGGILLFALVSLLIFFEKPLVKRFGNPPRDVESSRAVRFTRGHSLLSVVPLPIASKLERLADAAKDPRAAQEALAQEPDLKALLEDPALKSALQNDSFLRALKSGDLSALKNNPRLAALLKDPRLTRP